MEAVKLSSIILTEHYYLRKRLAIETVYKGLHRRGGYKERGAAGEEEQLKHLFTAPQRCQKALVLGNEASHLPETY